MLNYEVIHTAENDIERVSFYPADRRYVHPIVMQHGKGYNIRWWATWQRALAELGWESHAHSLPEHDGALAALAREIERRSQPPVLMGHSTGGALVQAYLEQSEDVLPAAVLVASQPVLDYENPLATDEPFNDPVMKASPYPLVSQETPSMIGDDTVEVAQVTASRPALAWSLNQDSRTPLLWLIPGSDRVIPPGLQEYAARRWDAAVIHVPGAGHDLIREPYHADLAREIHEWLRCQPSMTQPVRQ